MIDLFIPEICSSNILREIFGFIGFSFSQLAALSISMILRAKNK